VSRESKGANEALFREVNERLEDRAANGAGQAEAFEIICECAHEECTDRILVTFAEYEAVREHATRFILLPGHADPAVERTIASVGSYEIVEKFGEAGDVAAIADPRDGET
jgi:hypothetical protein